MRADARDRIATAGRSTRASVATVLACDVGGTKTDLALLEPGEHGLEVVRRATYASREHASLDEIVASFVGPRPGRLAAAGFGVPGHVLGDRGTATNLPWSVDGAGLARALGLLRVSLLNDVEALAWAVPTLSPSEQISLQSGAAPPGGASGGAPGGALDGAPGGALDGAPGGGGDAAGTMAVIAAGTGLGYAALVRGAGEQRSLASEGGHADFSPVDDVEIDLLRSLQRRFGHVSVERVVSGPGLYRMYEHLCERRAEAVAGWDEELRALGADGAGDPSAAVARAALEGRSALAEQAVLRFLGCYGAEAGNWALRTFASGGVWLGGGVARKLLLGPEGTSSDWRERARAAFLARFRAKGRLTGLLDTIPVRVIVSDLAAIVGVALFARAEHER